MEYVEYLTVCFAIAMCTLGHASDSARIVCVKERPLGMENGDIKDSQLTGFSYGRHHLPSFARLNNDKFWRGNNHGDGLCVNMLSLKTITKLSLQGSGTSYVSTFMIHHSMDAILWTEYRSPEYDKRAALRGLDGMKDSNSLINYTFVPPFRAQFVELRPLAKKGYGAVRIELYGCDSVQQNGKSMSTRTCNGGSNTSAITGDHARWKRLFGTQEVKHEVKQEDVKQEDVKQGDVKQEEMRKSELHRHMLHSGRLSNGIVNCLVHPQDSRVDCLRNYPYRTAGFVIALLLLIVFLRRLLRRVRCKSVHKTYVGTKLYIA